MDYFDVLAFLFGALGIIANIIIYQQMQGKKMLLCKLVSDVLWAMHYMFLGAYSGMAVAFVGLFRESVFLIKNKKGVSKRWLLLFILFAIVSAILTWKSVWSILPAVASVLSVISFWRGKPKFSRAIAYPISACMLTYDIYCLSYTGIANELFTLVSSTVGIIRNKMKSDKD